MPTTRAAEQRAEQERATTLAALQGATIDLPRDYAPPVTTPEGQRWILARALYESIADRADGGRRYRQLESWGLAVAPH